MSTDDLGNLIQGLIAQQIVMDRFHDIKENKNWTCPRCTLFNERRVIICEACEAMRPRSASSSSSSSSSSSDLLSQLFQVFDDEESKTEKGTPPTDPSVLKGLTKLRIDPTRVKERGQESCSICLCEFEDGEDALQLPCFDVFHECCIEPWLKKHCECPNCRKHLPSIDTDFNARLEKKEKKEKQEKEAKKAKEKKISIRQMQVTLRDKGVSVAKVVERRDLIDLWVKSLTCAELKTALLKLGSSMQLSNVEKRDLQSEVLRLACK